MVIKFIGWGVPLIVGGGVAPPDECGTYPGALTFPGPDLFPGTECLPGLYPSTTTYPGDTSYPGA